MILGGSFSKLSEEEIVTHLAIKTYGRFTLSKAVSPSYDLEVTPSAGFRRDCYFEKGDRIPLINISASVEHLLGLFYDIAKLLGSEVAVMIEHRSQTTWQSLARSVDLVVVLSHLVDFEDLLLDDGFFEISICEEKGNKKIELHFDDHKLMHVHNWTKVKNELLEILRRYGIQEDDDLALISEGEHFHLSHDLDFNKRRTRELMDRIGAEQD